MILNITHKNSDNVIVKISGRIDTNNIAYLEDQLLNSDAINESHYVTFDFSSLKYISSSGLRLFLKFKKKNIDFEIVDLSTEVYEIFEMTGFTDMFKISRAMRNINVTNHEILGHGANGTVYKIDNETILKLYNNKPNIMDEILNEREHAKYALLAGIPTAISFDIVKSGDKYGTVFELINAKSMAGILGDDISLKNIYLPSYVELLKTLHAIPYKKTEKISLPDANERYLRHLGQLKDKLPASLYDTLCELSKEIPFSNTLLHGDCHPNNIMVTKDELLFIDMDTLSVGNPIFDFSYLYSTLIGYRVLNPNDDFFRFSLDESKEIWNTLMDMYYSELSKEDLEKYKAICKCISHAQIYRNSHRHPDKRTDEDRKNALTLLTKAVNAFCVL